MAEAAISEVHGLCSSDLHPLPENRIVVGFGMVSVDYVAIVDAFPKPDEKVRGRSLQVFGGGNAANALTCASRLGLTPKLITKVGDDSLGQIALAELEADGVDTSLVKISDGGTSTSTYVIVDKQMKTRTCIYTLGVPAMVPDDLPKTKLLSALNEAKLAYFDGRSTKPALVVAQEAARMSIPILVEAERQKAGLASLLDLATYIICSEKFPQAWTSASSIPKALVSILLKYPKVKFVIATLGEKGCIMIDRRTPGEDPHLDAIDVDSLTESLKLRIDENVTTPTFVASEGLLRRYLLRKFLILLVPVMHLLEQSYMLYVQECLLRKCCHFPVKWQQSVAGHWVLVLDYHRGAIRVWLHSWVRLMSKAPFEMAFLLLLKIIF